MALLALEGVPGAKAGRCSRSNDGLRATRGLAANEVAWRLPLVNMDMGEDEGEIRALLGPDSPNSKSVKSRCERGVRFRDS
jgi:hypothetical protein